MSVFRLRDYQAHLCYAMTVNRVSQRRFKSRPRSRLLHLCLTIVLYTQCVIYDHFRPVALSRKRKKDILLYKLCRLISSRLLECRYDKHLTWCDFWDCTWQTNYLSSFLGEFCDLGKTVDILGIRSTPGFHFKIQNGSEV